MAIAQGERPQLGATPGAVGVLHTHSRRLDFHPHVHMVMPAAALDTERGLWRTKCRRTRRGAKKSATASAGPTLAGGYLFNHKALAKVLRAKVLDAIKAAGLTLPDKLPSLWVVDCKCVGDGQQALLYLGRYLHRGVIQGPDILGCKAGLVTFRYRDAKTGKSALRTLPGADFLWLVLQHVLPKGLRRVCGTHATLASCTPTARAPAGCRRCCTCARPGPPMPLLLPPCHHARLGDALAAGPC